MDAGYNVMFFQSNESYEREVLNVQSLLSSRVDGVLISLAKTTRKYGHIKQMIDNDVPVVFFDRACDEIETDKVIVDDFDGALRAVELLIHTGCKRIAHFAATQHLQIGYQRKRGYITALEKNGIKVDDDLIIHCDTFEGALEETKKIMSLPSPPDSFFAVNDMTAMGILNIIKQMGLKVPQDISIVGFTDGLVSTVSDPLLTTVSQHGFEMGKRAAKILVKRLNNLCETDDPLTDIIKTDLIIRGSTKKL